MYTRQDRKKDVLVNTPTLAWVYTRTQRILRKGKKRSLTQPASVVSPMKRDAVYLNIK
jgi:hypothetical protein